MLEITYRKEGDYFIPDLYFAKEDYENDYIIGKYGHLRLKYLKIHLTFANSCFKIYVKFTKIGSDISL